MWRAPWSSPAVWPGSAGGCLHLTSSASTYPQQPAQKLFKATKNNNLSKKNIFNKKKNFIIENLIITSAQL